MSSGYWQTERRREQFSTGKCATQRVSDYVKKWETRCYENGIPDSVPDTVNASGRVPSYKAIAMAILRGDLNFYSLGFARKESALSLRLHQSMAKSTGLACPQIEMNFSGDMK